MSRALDLVDSSDEARKHERPNAATAPLGTKLFVPRSHSGIVPRPRLIETLGDGSRRRFTVVIAPAGFGKTTLLAEWLSR